MKIRYTLDDSAARLPLTIRSADAVWDRAADLRNAPGVQLVEITTQHMANTGATLLDELGHYFDHERPSDTDPYALQACYQAQPVLEDLWRHLSDGETHLVDFSAVEALFPPTFKRELHFMLALTTVGFPVFGYVRTYKDSEDEEYHGMVINLAQAQPHLESLLGEFSLSMLLDTIRHGFFNHEGFLLAYAEYCESVGHVNNRLADRIKHALLSRGIAWYLSYQHNLDFYDDVLANTDDLAEDTARFNQMLIEAGDRRALDDAFDDLVHAAHLPNDSCIDVVGYHAARTIADELGTGGLRTAIVQGPDHFINLYNMRAEHKLQV